MWANHNVCDTYLRRRLQPLSESWDRSHDHVVDGNNMLHALGLVRPNMKPEAFQAARSRFVADLKRLWTGPGHLLVCLDGHENPAIAMAHRGQVVSRHLETQFSLQQSADTIGMISDCIAHISYSLPNLAYTPRPKSPNRFCAV